jgi:hypothetical protein
VSTTGAVDYDDASLGEVPASRLSLAALGALAAASAALSVLGLSQGSPGDGLGAVYIAGLVGATLSAGIVAYAVEGRRQTIARARCDAHLFAAKRERDGLDPGDLAIGALDLVVLEEARDLVHAGLLRRALAIDESDASEVPVTPPRPLSAMLAQITSSARTAPPGQSNDPS